MSVRSRVRCWECLCYRGGSAWGQRVNRVVKGVGPVGRWCCLKSEDVCAFGELLGGGMTLLSVYVCMTDDNSVLLCSV